MNLHAFATARAITDRCLQQTEGDVVDGRTLMKAALAGYLSASGVPTDEAVAQVERLSVPGLVGPVPENPLYYGLPWVIAGPVSGVPYYADRPGEAWGATWR